MRITGGKARGIQLSVPTGDRVRPAMDATRLAIFSHLGPLPDNATVLDLFAGSGAYGLEALSRGAASADFVEMDRKTHTFIQNNITAVLKSLGSSPRTQLHQSDVFRWSSPRTEGFTLIFVDPPYALWDSHGASLLELTASFLAQTPDARLILEAPGSWSCPDASSVSLRLVKHFSRSRQQPSSWVFAPNV